MYGTIAIIVTIMSYLYFYKNTDPYKNIFTKMVDTKPKAIVFVLFYFLCWSKFMFLVGSFLHLSVYLAAFLDGITSGYILLSISTHMIHMIFDRR